MHIRSSTHGLSYLYAFLFLLLFSTLNYSIDFENQYLDKYLGTSKGILFNFLFFSLAYYGMAVGIALIKNHLKTIKTTGFWLKSSLFLLTIGLFNGYYLFPDLVNSQDNYSDYVYLFYLSNALKGWVFYLIPLLLVFFLFEKSKGPVYGFKTSGVDFKPYFYLLLAATPFIIFASFLPDFQDKYPFFKPWKYPTVFGGDSGIYALVFEIAYGTNFIFLEWVFRGALVIGMSKVMGKEALLPMVSAYAFLHFGKPWPETVAAIFGGYLLGILALYSKSIFGGCLIHVGVALLMDLAAYVQHALAD